MGSFLTQNSQWEKLSISYIMSSDRAVPIEKDQVPTKMFALYEALRDSSPQREVIEGTVWDLIEEISHPDNSEDFLRLSERILIDPTPLTRHIRKDESDGDTPIFYLLKKCLDTQISAAQHNPDQSVANAQTLATQKRWETILSDYELALFLKWGAYMRICSEDTTDKEFTDLLARECMLYIDILHDRAEQLYHPSQSEDTTEKQHFLERLYITLTLSAKWDHYFGNEILYRDITGIFNMPETVIDDLLLLTCTEAGIDKKSLQADWRRNLFKKEFQDDNAHVRENLMHIIALNNLCGMGAVKILHEPPFNISNFARYPIPALVDQYEHREDTKAPYGVLISAKFDHNKALNDGAWLNPLYESLRVNGDPVFHLRVVEAGSLRDATRNIVGLASRYDKERKNKIAFLIIDAHGHRNFFAMDALRPHTNTPIPSRTGYIRFQHLSGKGISRGVQRFFRPNIAILIKSCKGANRMGVSIHKLFGPQSHVVATTVDNSLDKAFLVQDQMGDPFFVPVFDKRKSKKYLRSFGSRRGIHSES